MIKTWIKVKTRVFLELQLLQFFAVIYLKFTQLLKNKLLKISEKENRDKSQKYVDMCLTLYCNTNT